MQRTLGPLLNATRQTFRLAFLDRTSCSAELYSTLSGIVLRSEDSRSQKSSSSSVDEVSLNTLFLKRELAIIRCRTCCWESLGHYLPAEIPSPSEPILAATNKNQSEAFSPRYTLPMGSTWGNSITNLKLRCLDLWKPCELLMSLW